MSDRCRYVYDREIGRFFLPGCMGAAVYGDGGCTCPTPPLTAKQTRSIEDRLDGIERLLAFIVPSPAEISLSGPQGTEAALSATDGPLNSYPSGRDQ